MSSNMLRLIKLIIFFTCLSTILASEDYTNKEYEKMILKGDIEDDYERLPIDIQESEVYRRHDRSSRHKCDEFKRKINSKDRQLGTLQELVGNLQARIRLLETSVNLCNVEAINACRDSLVTLSEDSNFVAVSTDMTAGGWIYKRITDPGAKETFEQAKTFCASKGLVLLEMSDSNRNALETFFENFPSNNPSYDVVGIKPNGDCVQFTVDTQTPDFDMPDCPTGSPTYFLYLCAFSALCSSYVTCPST